ncbi:MAG: sulfite exporter TauE/SafE family protein [Myxococcales bacterium]|nr:sulfite exporter TauE/SafE family protein [Myxococcales bacterium]
MQIADVPWLTEGLLFVGGAVAGFVNAVAGGGSALTLPILMLSGLDAGVANGTNRVAVTVQSAASAATFHRRGVRPWRAVARAACFALPGAVAGALVAVRLPPLALERLFGVVFLALAVLMVARPAWLTPAGEGGGDRWPGAWGAAGLFAVGLYGGLFQAGVGIPLLVLLVGAMELDLVAANAVKGALVAVYTAVVLLVFGGAGQIAWGRGAVLAAGGLLGSVLGARAAIDRGAPFIRKLVFVALVAAGLEALW